MDKLEKDSSFPNSELSWGRLYRLKTVDGVDSNIQYSAPVSAIVCIHKQSIEYRVYTEYQAVCILYCAICYMAIRQSATVILTDKLKQTLEN